VVEEIAKVCGSHGLTVAAHNSLGCWPIHAFGTPEQKERFLKPASQGEFLLAFGLTEAGAGSDAGGTRTTAVQDGDDWVINGSKMWITNSHFAGAAIITAVTNPETGPGQGISAFIVPMDTPGFKVEKKEDKLGMRASDTAAGFPSPPWRSISPRGRSRPPVTTPRNATSSIVPSPRSRPSSSCWPIWPPRSRRRSC